MSKDEIKADPSGKFVCDKPLPPVADRLVLHTIADEEAVQFRTLNLLYSIFQLRGCPKPEGCHGLWNSFKRAVSSSELMGTSLKCTFLCNLGHGAWMSGADFVNIQEAAEHLMSCIDSDWLSEVGDRVAFDRDDDQGGAPFTQEQFLSSNAVQKRTPFAKQKSWFGILESFGSLDFDWTVFEECISHYVSCICGREDPPNVVNDEDEAQRTEPEDPGSKNCIELDFIH